MENIVQNLREQGKNYGLTAQDLNSIVRLAWQGDGQLYRFSIEGLQLSPIVVVRGTDDNEIYRYPIEEVLRSMGREMPEIKPVPQPTPKPNGKPVPPLKGPEAEKNAKARLSTKHMQMDAFMAICKAALAKPQARINILLKGAAGSGKSTAAEIAADILFPGKNGGKSTRYFGQSMGPQTSKSDLMGFRTPVGKYVEGICYEPFVNGGLLNLDELDASNAGVLTTLNSLLSNNKVSFPCGMRTRHPKFLCVASANTWGLGADSVYVGRQKLDGATLNRFVKCSWDYDEAFERHLVQDLAGKDKKDQAVAADWCNYVQTLRAAAFRTGQKVMFSPRQSLHGSTLLLAGQSRADVEHEVLWADVAMDAKQKVLANLAA